MKADMHTRSIESCELAVDIILKGMAYVNSGFILSPCEIKGLLGIKPAYPTWHLHRKVGVLVKILKHHELQIDISPASGISVTQIKPSRDAFKAISTWVH
jgi:hypothetical protein